MEMNKAIEAMIQQAESLNAGKATLEFDYGNGWEVMIAVKRKTSFVNGSIYKFYDVFF